MESVIALIRSFTSSVSSLLIRTPSPTLTVLHVVFPCFALVYALVLTRLPLLLELACVCVNRLALPLTESHGLSCMFMSAGGSISHGSERSILKHLLCRPLAPRHEVVLHKKAGPECCCVSANLDWVILSSSSGNGFVRGVSRVLVYGVTDKEHGDFTQFSLGKSSKVTVEVPAPLLFVKCMFCEAEIILRSNKGKHVCTFIMAQIFSR